MYYLVTHIAACLVFAQLLGVLLGWLLWGYMARQRAIENRSLRERIADLQILAPRMALAGDPGAFVALPESQQPAAVSAPAELVSEVTGADIEGSTPDAPAHLNNIKVPPAPRTALAVDDLEAEVKEARLIYLEQQVRELEGMRDRLPLVQADLSYAISARREAESKLEEARGSFEVRESNLLMQIRDFERAAAEWDRVRDELERSEITREKELAAVRAHLRDIQNNQLPQKAEPPAPAGVSLVEHADLRERYQKALIERDALAAQLESWKQRDNPNSDSHRIADLEEALRIKESALEEQLAQTETLLWRVAELEPFALAAPRLEEDLHRQESEIAGHVAMHAESAEHIRTLLNRINDLESESAHLTALQDQLNERDAEIAYHKAQLTDVGEQLAQIKAQLDAASHDHAQALQAKDTQLSELHNTLATLRDENAATVERLQSHIEELASEARRAAQYEHQARRVEELEPEARRAAELDKALSEREAEIRGLLALHTDAQAQLDSANHRLAELERLQSAEQERFHALESQLAQHQSDCHGKLTQLEEKHRAELTNLKTGFAQRMRRVRQSLRS